MAPESPPEGRLKRASGVADVSAAASRAKPPVAGCGQGYLCRLLADRGASVVGVEPVASMIDYAESMERDGSQGVEYHQRDLSLLGDDLGVFDAVVANMVFLDIPDWQPAMGSCVASLHSAGRFVFSLEHQCWSRNAGDT